MSTPTEWLINPNAEANTHVDLTSVDVLDELRTGSTGAGHPCLARWFEVADDLRRTGF